MGMHRLRIEQTNQVFTILYDIGDTFDSFNFEKREA